MKQSSTTGTPVRHVNAGNGQGFNGQAKPKGMSGTVNKQFEGDQKGNRQEGIASGTPYQSRAVNDDRSGKGSTSKYGMVIDDAAGNLADPSANGNGTLFDGVDKGNAYKATPRPTLDSPVASSAPVFDAHTVRPTNQAHLGSGVSPAITGDILADIPGGVMSRGMVGTSTPKGGETELIEDDELRNLGRGGAVG